jgi:hypothetical protein
VEPGHVLTGSGPLKVCRDVECSQQIGMTWATVAVRASVKCRSRRYRWLLSGVSRGCYWKKPRAWWPSSVQGIDSHGLSMSVRRLWWTPSMWCRMTSTPWSAAGRPSAVTGRRERSRPEFRGREGTALSSRSRG